jgi:hypothetical protein
MARDVAQRELDQAGLRILNIGNPTSAGDATKTDNTTVPLPASGTGAAGRSFLAAPIDHVHPATAGSGAAAAIVPVDFDGEQEVTGTTEEVVGQRLVDFAPFASGNVSAVFSASVDVDSGTATFNVRVGGTSGQPDGTIVATIPTQAAAPAFEDKIAAGLAQPRPTGPALVKVTAVTDNPNTTCRIKNQRVVLTG